MILIVDGRSDYVAMGDGHGAGYRIGDTADGYGHGFGWDGDGSGFGYGWGGGGFGFGCNWADDGDFHILSQGASLNMSLTVQRTKHD